MASVPNSVLADARPQGIAKWGELKGPLVALLIALVIPMFVGGYYLFELTMMLIMAIAVLGLNLVVGYNGQLSVGHGAFYALGAYLTAILITQAGMPYWAAIPVAGAISLVFGFLFGWPAVRFQGLYLALATFSLAWAMPQILKYDGLAPWTGGVQGTSLSKPQAPWGLPLDEDQWLYYVTVFVTAVVFLCAWNLIRGRIGRAIIATREHPLAASAMGVNVTYYKAMTFGISAMFTGIAGGLAAVVVQFVSPDSFDIFLSVAFLIGVIVGGVATIWGALVGGAFIQFVPSFASQLSDALPWAIYGVFLIIAVFLMPRGFMGLLEQAKKRLGR